MKPPKLNKLSKKELKKLYANQWKQNIIIVSENVKLNTAFVAQRNASETYAKSLTEVSAQLESSTAMKESLLKILNRVRRKEWEQEVNIPEEGDLYLLTEGEYFGMKNRAMIAGQDLRMIQEAILVNQEDKNKIREELENTKEALDRSRQLRKSFQEVADRNIGENNTIEEMAENVYEIFHGYIKDVYMGWEDLPEESKDIFRVMATRIVAEKPQAS